jgi:hypothetical protein
MEQEIIPAEGTKRLLISYVVPQNFNSPSYRQIVDRFDIQFSQDPDIRRNKKDKRGNEIIMVVWQNPRNAIRVKVTLEARNQTILKPIEAPAPFPLRGVPRKLDDYLEATRQVPADDPAILELARRLTKSAESQYDAVQAILTWVVDHIRYVQRPKNYDAWYAIRERKGNCQNYSHVAAALMRAVGIPVRIVNGVTSREPYHVAVSGGKLTLRMGQGRHSWIEVYFPTLGWVPFDPQQMQLFVSNRFIRTEVGMDNEECINDGSVYWTSFSWSRGVPRFRETVNTRFTEDRVNLKGEKQPYGPKRLLLSPPIELTLSNVVTEHASAEQIELSPQQLRQYTYDRPFTWGNLDFPEKTDFLETRDAPVSSGDTAMVMLKNFLVETAEYVTTNGMKYAQTFILENPLKLKKAGLALHKFGGEGQLWVELLEDDGKGKPGKQIATSRLKSMNDIRTPRGYSWINFDFQDESLVLGPGRYWLALAYTGSPVVNWFFTYGKPVGPIDGTRYNTMFDDTWSHSLAYEFNYRVEGYAGR